MKKIIGIFLVFCLVLQACDKDEAATKGFDFSSSIPPYVELTSTTTRNVRPDTTLTFTFQMRTALQEVVTVYFDAMGGGLNLTNQTVVIDRNKLTASVNIKVPANAIVAPNTTATAVLTLVKAVTASGTQLTIGQKSTPEAQKVTINIKS